MDDARLLAVVRTALAERPGVALHSEVDDIIRIEAVGVISDVGMLEILRAVREETVGAGVLDMLLRRPDTSDVLVTAPGEIWADTGNRLGLAEIPLTDGSKVRAYAVRLTLRYGQRLDGAQPWADGYIPGGVDSCGVRVHAVLSPPSATGTQISLRVLRPARHGPAGLCDIGLSPPEILSILRGIVAGQLSFIVARGTGAGETTLLAAVLSEVNPDQCIVCIEDTPELQPQHPHAVKPVTRATDSERAGAIGQQELLKRALRMCLDHIIVGKTRGAKMVDLLAVLSTGHRGGAETIHANRIGDVVVRFEALGLIGGPGRAGLRAQLVSAAQVVLVAERAGARRLAQIGLLCNNPPEAMEVWTVRDGPGSGQETL